MCSQKNYYPHFFCSLISQRATLTIDHTPFPKAALSLPQSNQQSVDQILHLSALGRCLSLSHFTCLRTHQSVTLQFISYELHSLTPTSSQISSTESFGTNPATPFSLQSIPSSSYSSSNSLHQEGRPEYYNQS